jgi:hypothetical protein
MGWEQMPQLFNIDHHSQPPIQHKNIRLVPFTRSVSLRLPGQMGGFIWGKPTSLLVAYPDGREEVLSIPDQTGRLLLYMLLSGLFGWLVFRWLSHKIISRRSI